MGTVSAQTVLFRERSRLPVGMLPSVSARAVAATTSWSAIAAPIAKKVTLTALFRRHFQPRRTTAAPGIR